MMPAIAAVFRSLNAQLLYRDGLINPVLKLCYLISGYFFKRWIAKKRPSQLTTINNFGGNLKIQVDLSKTMGASIYWTGFHEFKEMRFLHSFLKKEMTFIDVGANQGEFSLFAAGRLSGGRVLAFEPMSLFFDRLTLNVKLNNMTNIKCFQLGLSDRAGETEIYFNDDNQLNHEGLASLFTLNKDDQRREIIQVRMLDDIVQTEKIGKIDLIKIDVEGSEWAALRGSEKVLKQYKPALMVELNDATAALAGYKVEDMINWLKTFGYTPHRIVRKGLEPLQVRPPFCNAVFLTH